jgi:hypothetical protein
MFESAREAQPGMLRFLPYRPHWGWKLGIGECADCDRGKAWRQFRRPIQGGSAVGTKVKFEFPPRVSETGERFALSGDADVLTWVVGADSKGGATATLALAAMAGDHECTIAVRFNPKHSAAAVGYSFHI